MENARWMGKRPGRLSEKVWKCLNDNSEGRERKNEEKTVFQERMAKSFQGFLKVSVYNSKPAMNVKWDKLKEIHT